MRQVSIARQESIVSVWLITPRFSEMGDPIRVAMFRRTDHERLTIGSKTVSMGHIGRKAGLSDLFPRRRSSGPGTTLG